MALGSPVQSQTASARVDAAQTFQEAIRKGDLAAVKTALEADPKLLTNAGRGTSPLYTAIQSGKSEIVIYLLEKGADPNGELYSNTPLSTALNNYSETWKPIAEALVAKGAKINGVDGEGSTPLLRAISYGGNTQKDKLSWLLSKGADLTARNRSGKSALETALAGSSSEIVTLLLDKADVKARDDNGATPLFAAVSRGNAQYVRQILDKGADVNAQNALGDTVLHLAAQNPGAMLKTLLDAGAKTDLKNHRGDLPLHVALRRRDENLVPGRIYYSEYSGQSSASTTDESVTPRGAIIAPLTDKSDVNAKDQFGVSPLLLAILSRDQESRDLIIESKPKMDATTQLFDAVAQGNVAVGKTLLTQKPFLVYFRLPDGTTPLHVSALWGTLGAAQFLTQKGADVNARDSRGETPLHEALARPSGLFARRSKNMTAFLLEKGANFNALDQNDGSPLHRAVKSGDAELISALLAKAVNVNARDKAGLTPIFALMTKTSELKLVQALIEKGAIVDVRPPGSAGLLSRAVQTRRKELVQLLLDKGANVGAKDSEGRSALGTLLLSSSSNSSEDSAAIAEMLLAKGADPNEKVYGESLLARAISNDSKEVVRVLLATKKIDLKAGSEGRQSPLRQAVNYGRTEMISLLLEAGADPTEKDEQGKTIAEMAATRSPEMAALFKPKVAAG